MRRTARIAGSLLMLGGIAILVYVGMSYVRGKTTAKSPTWSRQQQNQGRVIAQRLVHHQSVAVPANVALPPAGGEVGVRLVIPKIALDAPIRETPPVNGVWQVADWAVGHLTSTPNPGAAGNMALSAHDDIKGEIFKRVNELAPGNQILIYAKHAVYTYVVTNERVVDPSDVSVLNPTQAATVTLISCTPYWVDTQRLIIQATLKTRAAV